MSGQLWDQLVDGDSTAHMFQQGKQLGSKLQGKKHGEKMKKTMEIQKKTTNSNSNFKSHSEG